MSKPPEQRDMTVDQLLPDEARRLLHDGRAEAAGESLLQWASALVRSRPGEALAWAGRMLAAEPGPHPFAAYVRWTAGAVFHVTGHSSLAGTLLERAARSFAAGRRRDLADRVSLLLVDVYGDTLATSKARRLARRLEPRFRAAGDRQRAAAVLANLGGAEDAADRIARAAALWRRALRLLADDRQSLKPLLVRANLANAAASEGRLDDAIQGYAAVVTAARSQGLEALALQAELNLAETEFALGRVGDAFQRWLEVADRSAAAGDPLLELVARLDLAGAESSLGSTASARRRLDEVLPRLQALGQQLEVAKAARLLAVIEASSERADRAVISRARQLLDRPALAVQRELLEAELVQLDATADAARSRRAARRLARWGLRGRALVTLAWTARRYQEQGRTRTALSLAKEVLHDRRASPWARMTAHAVCWRCHGATSTGWRHLNLAVRAAEQIQGKLQSMADRSAFLASFGEVYVDLIWRLVQRNRAADRRRCLQLLDRLKSAWLSDELGRRADSGSDPHLQRWQELRHHLAASLELAQGEQEPRTRRSGLAVAGRVGELERQLQVMETDLARRRPALVQTMLPGPATVPDELLQRLPEDHLYVEYLLSRGDLLSFVVSRGQVQVTRQRGVAAQIERLVSSVRFQVDAHPWAGADSAAMRRRSLESRLRSLGRLLLAPIPAHGWQTLWLAPHGSLYHLPWVALEGNDGTALLDRGVVTLVPGAAAAGLLLQEPAPAPQRVVLSAAGGGRLVMVEGEIASLAKAMPTATTVTGVTRQRFLELLGEADILHLAGHALFLDGLPSASGLQLEDGFVTVHDLVATRTRASLVTFGVCSGARLAQQDPFRYEGFLRALLGSGVRTVIGPVAQVHDTTARTFDELLYDKLVCTGAPGPAFRSAVLELRRLDEHPATWSSFHLHGHVSPWRRP